MDHRTPTETPQQRADRLLAEDRARRLAMRAQRKRCAA